MEAWGVGWGGVGLKDFKDGLKFRPGSEVIRRRVAIATKKAQEQ